MKSLNRCSKEHLRMSKTAKFRFKILQNGKIYSGLVHIFARCKFVFYTERRATLDVKPIFHLAEFCMRRGIFPCFSHICSA